MAQLHPSHLKWVHLVLLFLFLRLHGGCVDAQASVEPVPTYISHHRWEPSFAITTGAIILVLLSMGIISIYIRKCTDSHPNMTNNNRTNQTRAEWTCSCSQQQGITKEQLNTFPILFYPTIKDLKIGKGSLECAVCLTDFKDCDTLRLLPKCNHVFHPQCIDSWLCSHVTCPVCRANLNQDSCEVSVTVPTHLSTPQSDDESSGTRGESNGGEENEGERNPAAESEVQGKTGSGVASKPVLLRSNSTGHSLEEPGNNVERFTLRLPEDVRRYILVNHGGRVHRSASYNNGNGNSAVRGVCWSDTEGSSVEKKGNGGEVKGGCFGAAMVEN